MREEIFGPLLPVVTYGTLEDAYAYIGRRDPSARALLVQPRSQRWRTAVLERTLSGGVTINDTLLTLAQEELPFGGVGASGMGGYHGEAGFRTFSHAKSVFLQSKWSGLGLMSPPYERMFRGLERWVRKVS